MRIEVLTVMFSRDDFEKVRLAIKLAMEGQRCA